MENDGYGLLFDVGLGKSLTAIAAAGARHKRGQVKRLLIVCPLAVTSVWERECKSLTVEHTAHILAGSRAKRLDALRHFPKDGLQIAIVNYEGALILKDDLIKWQPDMLICDESQRIKDPTTGRAKAIHAIAKGTKYRLILTATPVGNSVRDVFSQWKVIDASIFGASYFCFKKRYLVMGGYGNHAEIGTKNMAELLAKAHSKALRVTKDEALDLPMQVFEDRRVELEPVARRIYDDLRTECVSELNDGEITASNILAKLVKLQQCAGGFLKADYGERVEQVSRAKLDLLWDTLRDILAAGEKAVIFCRFTPEIEAISRLLDKNKVEHAILSGATKDKGETVNAFQEGGKLRVLVCQIQVGGVGITLTAASVMIFYSASFSFIDYSQAVGRTHRISQSRRCLYINLIAKNTVDEHIYEAIANKKNLSDNVVDNWRRYVFARPPDTS
jgi:SNF2 family DNA or RNA helicase